MHVYYLRGINRGAIHECGIVVVFHKVTTFGEVTALLWFLTGDLHFV